jgi:transposase InsO family protein
MKYRFIEKHQTMYPVGQQCCALGVSRSGYYAWRERRKKGEDDARRALIEHIRRIHKKSRRTYGSPRIHAELRAEGVVCNHKRVARLMRLEGIQGRRKRRKAATTDSKHPYPVAPNLLNREFEAEAPNEKWVADITYIPTREGWLYLAVVLDLYSRKIVGWSMSHQVTADLVEDALRMALYERQPDRGLLHHSDRGSQYASEQIRRILAANHIQVSMSRTANCYDNAVMESFFSTLKCEWVHHQDYKTRTEACRDIFEYIAGFYNTIRRHSTLGYVSPNQFEANGQHSP